ncbi:hypothetical protein, partial [Bacteroides sp. 51]|uniref:hypothetical protein n=1 Tax=Bacteroides sp. 51 TaxID=2302938 RepID=UPI0019402201
LMSKQKHAVDLRTITPARDGSANSITTSEADILFRIRRARIWGLLSFRVQPFPTGRGCFLLLYIHQIRKLNALILLHHQNVLQSDFLHD